MTKRAFFLAGLLAFLTLVSIGQEPVPIENEPMHRLKLENEFVRVFDVLVPVGKSSLFHKHVFDGVGVRVSDAEMSEEFTDGVTKHFNATWGAASFGSGPAFTHKVINLGKTDFRNIYIELLKREAPAKTFEIPPLTDAHVILINNARVRVSRLVLKPGESSKPHSHPLNGLGIVLYDSKIEISSPGSAPRIVESKPGDFVWQKAGTTHTIKNVGTSVFESIDIEIK
jgi:quercetin dioxygenase-like cupin family protein